VVGWDPSTHKVTWGSTNTWAKNWQSPAAGVGVSLEGSNARNVSQLGGGFDENGVGQGIWSAGGFSGPCILAPGGSVRGGSLGVGAGIPVPIELHQGTSNTRLKAWDGNDVQDTQER
jgi:hypothetical protein